MVDATTHKLTYSEKQRIAGRARTLQERLAESSPNDLDGQLDDLDQWIEEWRDWLGVDYYDNFDARLEQAGLSLEECRYRLEATGWPETRPLPDWIEEIDQLLDFIHQAEPKPMSKEIPDEDQEPFIHFFDVVGDYAMKQIEWNGATEKVHPDAIESFTGWLVQRIGGICSHSLFIEFKTYIGQHDRELALGDDPKVPADSRSYYKAFISQLFRGGFKNFLLEYSFLARLLATAIHNWIEAVEEFSVRLMNDWEDIEQRFSQSDLTKVVDIEAYGDPHQRGRVIFALKFESGERIVYKPRNIDVESAFFSFVSWLNEISDLPDLQTVECLTRDQYGWMGWVDTCGCNSIEEVRAYYRRAGMLLCVLYVLRFTDGHLENVLANQDQPVIVDLETIAEPVGNHQSTIENEITHLYNDSVLRKGFLPMHQPDSRLDGWNGFASAEAKETGIEIPEFKRPNTDLMELEFEDSRTFEGENLPTLDGKIVPPDKHSSEIIEGFRSVYDEFLDKTTEILEEDGALSCFKDVEIRYIFRSTHVYSAVLSSLTMPEYLRTGLPFGCKIESFARSFVIDDVNTEMWPIFEAEREALARLDIPRFSTTTDNTDLDWDECLIEDFFSKTPHSKIRERVAQLSESDREEQTDYIKLGYHEHGLLDNETGTEPIEEQPTVDSATVSTQIPREIFDRLKEHEQQTSQGGITWHLREHRQGGIFLHEIEDRLYSGRTGVAIFCGALHKTFGDESYAEYARTVLEPVLDDIENDRLAFDPLGIADGLGSVIYGLTTTGKLIDDDRCINAASILAEKLTPNRIYSDPRYGVFEGTAGTILALLTLYEETGDSELLETAETTGYHILSNRQSVNGGYGWPNEQGKFLAGFAHGTAGIAFALNKLGAVSGVPEFCDVARQSIAYEDSLYIESEQNWADIRDVASADYMDGWCNGRTGIGLARLGMDYYDGSNRVRRDLIRALNGLETDRLATQDHLCCGNFSRVEFLHHAGQILEDDKYINQAINLAQAAASRAEREGQFAGRWQTEHWYNPGFFTGETGIGYALLRLGNPDLPCVLLFE